MANGEGTAGLWKWLAAFLAGAMLAGAPTYGVLLSRPDQSGNIEQLRQQINALQVEQAHLSEQITALDHQLAALLELQQPR